MFESSLGIICHQIHDDVDESDVVRLELEERRRDVGVESNVGHDERLQLKSVNCSFGLAEKRFICLLVVVALWGYEESSRNDRLYN